MAVALRSLCFATGLCLLMLNFWGLNRSLRASDLDRAQLHPGDVSLDERRLPEQLPRRREEADAAYIGRITFLVHKAMAHYWGEEVDRYRLRVPAWENFLLYAASYVRPDIYRKYEFARPDEALERGVGLCSQQSLVLAGLLQREGIDARLQGLDGHVIVRATDRSGRIFLADPDYGAVIPHPIAVVEENPQMIRSYYLMPYVDAATADMLVRVYGAAGNREWTVPEYFYHKIYYTEKAAYLLKWLLPLLLLLPLLVRLMTGRNRIARFNR